MRSWACWAISAPWSQVSDRRSCSGSVVIVRGDRVADGLGAVAGQRRAVLDSRLVAVAVHAGQVQQHREPGGALDQRADRRAARAPMIRSPSQWPGTARSSASAGRSLIITSAVTNPLPRCRVRARGTRSARPVRRQATSSRLQRAAALDVQRLVDRLVRDPHRLIIGEVDPQPVRDLLRAPRRRPAPVLAPRPVATDPRAPSGPATGVAVRRGDRPGEPLLHVLAQPRRWRRAWPSSAAGRAARHATAPTDARYSSSPPRVAALRRSSREIVDGDRPSRRAISRTPQPCARRSAISSRSANDRYRPDSGARHDRRHPATLAEPPAADRRRHARRDRGVLARQPLGDRRPEPLPILTPRHRGRPGDRICPASPNRLLPLPLTAHRNHLHHRGVATTS